MEIVGSIFRDEESLTPALDALRDAGFETYMVFGPEDFTGEPSIENDGEADSATAKHTAAGTVSGMSVNPPAQIPDEPSTETIEDELMAVGLPRDDARQFVSELEQDRLLLLVQTGSGRATAVENIFRSNEGHFVRRIQPTDAFPEELWRNV